MTTGIVAFLCDPSASFDIQQLVVERTKASARLSRATHRIHVGALIPLAQERIAASFTAHTEGVGRRLTSSTYRAAADRELALLREALADCESVDTSRPPDAQSLLYQGADCVSVTGLPLDVVEEILDAARKSAWSVSAVRVRGRRAPSRAYFWNRLVPIAAFCEGVHLRCYEDDAESVGRIGGRRFFRPASSAGPEADGFFASEFGDPLVPEEGFAHLDLDGPRWEPVDSCPSPGAELVRSPVETVFWALGNDRVTRISARDDKAQPATVAQCEPVAQFPEPSRVLDKLRGYCLNPSHPERKWLGFADAGYRLGMSDEMLAHLLCSVFYGDFHPREARATADGSVQFGLDIALPQRHGGASQCQTAWLIPPGGPIVLSTAFVTGRCTEGDGVTLVPAAIADDPISPDTLAYVEREATEYGLRVRSSPWQAKGWLWIPHTPGANAAFAGRVRKLRGGSVFTRGGRRVTQWALPTGISGETQVVGALRKAQNLLGILGIESTVDVRGD